MSFSNDFRNAKNTEDIQNIIIKGGNPNMFLNDFLHCPIHYHCYNDNLLIVKYLIEDLDVDINIKNGYDNTPLHIVCCHGYMDIFDYLVSKGAKLSELNSCKSTPLIQSIICGNIDIVIKLLPLLTKDEICMIDTSGNAAYWAVRCGRLDILYHLTIYGIDLNYLDRNNKTLVDIAKDNGYTHIIDYLSNFNID